MMAQRQIFVHRAKPKETKIQNSIIWDNGLSQMARFSLIAMLSLPDEWDYSVRGMAVMLKISKDTMGKYLKELEAGGYLKRAQAHGEAGRFSKTAYLLTDTPGEFGEDVLLEPCPNLPDPVEPDPKKSPQKKRTEQKNGTEQNTPQSPPEGGAPSAVKKKRSRRPKAEPEWRPEKFEGFWKAYPKDDCRAKAVEQWDALPRDKELMDKHLGDEDALLREIALGLKRHLESRDWRENIGIPHAFRWLRDHRWTEKVKQPQAQPAPDPAAPRQKKCHTEIVNGEEVLVYDS